MLTTNCTASLAKSIHSIGDYCMQDRAAQLPQAGTQQTEQVGLNGPTAAAEVVTSLPPRTPSRAVSATAAQLSPAQQQAGLQSGGATASPLLSTRYSTLPPPPLPPPPPSNPAPAVSTLCQAFDTTLTHSIVPSNPTSICNHPGASSVFDMGVVEKKGHSLPNCSEASLPCF